MAGRSEREGTSNGRGRHREGEEEEEGAEALESPRQTIKLDRYIV